MYEGEGPEEPKQLLHISKTMCDFCEEPTYMLVMARDADSGETLLVCEGCATLFGGDWKDIKDN